jgi:O-antigen ligase
MMLAGLIMMLPDAVFSRITTGWDSGLNAVSAGRVDTIWLPLLPEVWASPLFGHGLGSIMWSQAMRAGSILQVTHPHNAYLQAVLDIGFLGLIVLAAYFIHVWKGFRRLSRDPHLDPMRRGFYEGASVGLVAFLISGFAGSSLLPVPEQCFLWLAIGMMYGERTTQPGQSHA